MMLNVRSSSYQDSIKKYREETQKGVVGTPVLESFMAKADKECKLYYKQWAPTACRDLMIPHRIGNVTKVRDVYDENLLFREQVALEFETARYGLYRNWAQAVKQQPGDGVVCGRTWSPTGRSRPSGASRRSCTSPTLNARDARSSSRWAPSTATSVTTSWSACPISRR